MNISDMFSRVDRLSAEETRKKIDDKEPVILVDVREPAEYESGHIPGAEFMPLSGLLNTISKIDSSKTVITYCKRGPRSKSAAALFKRKGFQDVLFMDGGMDAWNGHVARGQYESGMWLLEGRTSAEELALLAWSLEDGTGAFYSEMKNLCTDDDARNLFDMLIKAENSHKSKLMEACRQIKGEGFSDEDMQERAVRGYMEGGVSIEEAVGWVKNGNSELQDILELSMQIETNSLDLYLKILGEVEEGTAKEIFNNLIVEEETHLSRLGKLLESKIEK